MDTFIMALPCWMRCALGSRAHAPALRCAPSWRLIEPAGGGHGGQQRNPKLLAAGTAA